MQVQNVVIHGLAMPMHSRTGNLISAKIHQHMYMYICIAEYSYTWNRAKTASNDNHVTKAVELLYKEPTGM
jgi:hypothetical protein